MRDSPTQTLPLPPTFPNLIARQGIYITILEIHTNEWVECLNTFPLPRGANKPRQFSGLPLTLSKSVDSRLVRRESTTEGAPFTDGRQRVCCVDSWTCVVSPPFEPRPVRSTISEKTRPCVRAPVDVSTHQQNLRGSGMEEEKTHHEGREYAEGRVIRNVGAGEVRNEEDERRG